jgi:hypothetical protein
MTVNGCESSCAAEAQGLGQWDMPMSTGIPKLPHETKINQVYHVGLQADADGDVARFKIAVDEVARVDILQAMELDTVEVSPLVIALRSRVLTNCSAKSRVVLTVNRKWH